MNGVGQRANDVYGLELAERLRGSGVSVNILNPGMVDTGIRRNVSGFRLAASVMEFLMRPFTKTPEQFAELPIALVTSPNAAADKGVLVGANGKPLKNDAPKYSPALRSGLWEASERLVDKPLAQQP